MAPRSGTWWIDFAGDRIRLNSMPLGWTWSRVVNDLTGGDHAKSNHIAADFYLLGRAGDDGFNHHWLLEPIGCIPPAEA